MTQLGDLLGVLSGIKSATQSVIDTVYHQFQKPQLFNGFTKTYEPLDEINGDQFPPEYQLVQHNAEDLLTLNGAAWTRLIDAQAAVDATNQDARASVKVLGIETPELPATTLLWLEKALVDMRTQVQAAPVIAADKTWSRDPNTGLFKTEDRRTIKTKKVPQNHVRFEGNDKHPPQVDVYQADVTVGYWTGHDRSGAMSPTRKAAVLARIATVLEAVKLARLQANRVEAKRIDVGAQLVGAILGERD
jgi:hypothetical protein